MPTIALRFWLDGIIDLNQTDPGSRVHKKRLSQLQKVLLQTYTPPKLRRWERAERYTLILAIVSFVGLIAMAFLAGNRVPNRFSAAERCVVIGLFAVMMLSCGILVLMSIAIHRIARKWMTDGVERVQSRLRALPMEEVRAANALLWSDFPVDVFDPSETPCGCFGCIHTFPASELSWFPETPTYPLCPYCGSEETLVYSNGSVQVTPERIQLLHTLFDEEN